MTTTTARSTREEPRIRERRAQVRRARGRRRLHWLVALGVVLALAGIAWGAVHSPVLDVDRIRLEGVEQVDPVRVRAALGVEPGDPTLLVDTGAAETSLEALPWVETAQVRRQLPATVRVEIVERAPAGWIGTGDDRAALVDGTGRVLEVRARRDVLFLPELRGVDPLPTVGAWLEEPAVAEVAARLPNELRGDVVAATTFGDQAALTLGNGTEVRLGRVDDSLDARFASAAAVVEHLQGRAVSYVDVRVPEAPVVGP